MKKTLILCFILLAFCVVVFAKDAPPVVSTGNSATAPAAGVPTDEYSLAKDIYIRWEAGQDVSKEDLDLASRYFVITDRGRGDSGNPLDATGGPDPFWYYFVDSQGDSATFSWIELKGDPNATWLLASAFTSQDDGYTSTAISLPFSFPFYGGNYSSFRVGTNGDIQFTTSVGGGYGGCLPRSGVNGPTLFPFFEDLYLSRGGISTGNNVVGYESFGSYFVVQFDSIGPYSTTNTGSFNFQVLMFNDGRIKYQYRRMQYNTAAADSAATIGIQALGSGSNYLQYACNLTGYPVGGYNLNPIVNRAVWFYRQPPQTPELSVSNLAPCGSIWPANPAVPVSFRITNNGPVASSAVTAYFDFNNGITTGTYTVPSIAPSSFFDVLFSTTIDMSVAGSYPLKGWFLPHDNPSANDSVVCTVTLPTVRPCAAMTPPDANLDPMPNVPWAGSVSSNCGNGGKWNGSFTAVMGRDYHFDLCPDAPGNGTANFDIDIKICDANGNIITGQDGTCTALSYRPNNFTWTATANALFYVVLAPYSSYASHNCTGTAASTFTMEYYEALPCVVECPPNGVIEDEPLCANGYVDNWNGGCNSTPPIFELIQCGVTVCGKSGTYLNDAGAQTRDTDWYVITLAERDSVRWTVNAEFPVLAGIIASPCPNSAFYRSATSTACVPITVAACLDPGTWYFFVSPNTFTGVPCDADYTASLECVPCESAPCPYENRDIEPANNTCGNDPAVACGEFLCGRILLVGDNDFYTFTITERDTVTIDVYADDTPGQYPYGGGLDSYVVLYGAGCDSIAYDDDGGEGLDSRLVRACLDPGTYFIKVKGYGGTSTGPYILHLTCTACCSTPTVDFNSDPIPQSACATVCTGVATLVRICPSGSPFPADQPPIVNIVAGCQTNGCIVECNAAQFTYDPALWAINPLNGCWENVVTGMSNGCICVSLEGFLAVQLQSFTATAGDRSVTLNWITASETDNDYFELLRNDVKVAELDARGSSGSGATYTWTDHGLINGTTYTYSLVAVDMNNSRTVLKTIQSTPAAPLVITEYALHQNYPNPFNPTTSITFDLVDGGNVTLRVYNTLGQAVATLVNGNFASGRHTVNFDAAGLPSGLYIYRIESLNFVSQHKMLLMK